MNLVDFYKSTEEEARRSKSRKAWKIYDGDIHPYVAEYLQKILREDPEKIRELPVISSINVAKSVVNELTQLYKNSTKRDFLFEQGEDEKKDFYGELYRTLKVDNAMLEVNRAVEYERQVHVGLLPDGENFKIRIFRNSEISYINGFYIFEISEVNKNGNVVKAYEAWSKDVFIKLDENGKVIESTELNLDYSPIFKVSGTSFDGSYWRTPDYSLADFTIQFNAILTDIGHTVHLQSFSQPFLKKIAGSNDSELTSGKTEVMVLNKINGETEEFGYVTPSTDIQGCLNFVKTISQMYAQTKGVNSDVILGGVNKESFNSGVQRLLAMVERYERSLEYASVMIQAESDLFNAIRAWLKYTGAYDIGEDMINVEYKKPEAVKTLSEKIDDELKLESIGVQSRVETIAKVRGVPLSEAELIYDKNIKNSNQE